MGGRHVHEDPTFDPDTEAAALIEAQCAMPASCVGAFVQLTTIRRDRIETCIVTWFEDQFELAQQADLSRREELLRRIA